MKARAAIAAGLAILFAERSAAATNIPTIYDNYQMFTVGSRAAGMGGAYTALACDEAALHYQPAALACASESHLELAANAYVISTFTVPNALGQGENISAVTYHSVPSIFGGVRILRDGDADGIGRIAFGIGVSVPASLALAAKPSRPTDPNFLSVSVREDVTAGDLGLAVRLTKALSMGATIGAVLHTDELHEQLLVTSTTPSPCGAPTTPSRCTDFVYTTLDQSDLAIGGRAKLGVRYTPARDLSLGLTVVSPTIEIYGSSTIDQTTPSAVSNMGAPSWGVAPVHLTGSSEVGFPLRIAVGAAYATQRVTLSVDGSLNFPRDVRRSFHLSAANISGTPPPSSDQLQDQVLKETWQPNVNVGAAIGVSTALEVDVGAFTDLSGVDNTGLTSRALRDHIDMFGGTLALGILGRQSRGWFGISVEGGVADTAAARGRLDLEDYLASGLAFDATSRLTRFTVAGVIGSNYSFLKEK